MSFNKFFADHFLIISICMYTLYFLAFVGIYVINSNYMHLFSLIIQTSIAIFIIVTFSPFLNNTQTFILTRNEANIIHASGILLILNLFSYLGFILLEQSKNAFKTVSSSRFHFL
jgi:hypothetical protein